MYIIKFVLAWASICVLYFHSYVQRILFMSIKASKRIVRHSHDCPCQRCKTCTFRKMLPLCTCCTFHWAVPDIDTYSSKMISPNSMDFALQRKVIHMTGIEIYIGVVQYLMNISFCTISTSCRKFHWKSIDKFNKFMRNFFHYDITVFCAKFVHVYSTDLN